MPKIPDEIIQEILARTSLVELVRSYTEVSGSGGESLAKCPFHDDKVPSMSVSDDLGLYHCHACGASGNAIQYLMKMEGIEFRDALRELAGKAGVDVEGYFAPRHGSTGSVSEKPQKTFFLRKLIENLKTVSGRSICVSTYLHDKDPQSRKQPFRDNFTPGCDGKTGTLRTGTPDKGLNLPKLAAESVKQERMVSVGVSLFGLKTVQSKSGFWHVSKSRENATHCLMVSLDFDNVEWKAFKGNREYLNIGNRDKFLEETKERLYKRLWESLEKVGLLQFAVIIDSGSGYHVHFILEQIEPYSEIDMISEAGVFDCGQFHSYVVKSLVLLLGSDSSPVHRTSLFKMIPGTPYTKIVPHRKVEVKKDARGFLSLHGLYELLPDIPLSGVLSSRDFPRPVSRKRPYSELEKEFAVYEKSFQLFQALGRFPDSEFLHAMNRFYQSKPKPDDIETDFGEYIRNGTLPGGETPGDNYYNGREEWEGGDGSAIRITKDYLMKYRTMVKKSNAEGDYEWTPEWLTIPCGCALVPKYLIQGESDPEDYKIVFDAIREGYHRTVAVEGKKFGCADSLQKALRALQVDITLAQKSASALFSYALCYAKPIRPMNVGVNYDSQGWEKSRDVTDAEEREVKPFLAGYDWIYRDGRIFRGKDGIIETGEEVYYIKGYPLRQANEHRRKHARKSPDPDGKLLELRDKIDQLFFSPEVSRLYLSFLATAMLREPLLEKISGIPFLSLHGESGCGKTTLLEVAREIFNQQFLTNRPTISTTVKTQKHRKNGVMLFDELDENHLPYLMPFLKDSVTNAYRPRQDKEGRIVGDDQVLNTAIISTNLPLHYQGDPWDFRMVKIKFTKKARKLNVDGISDLRWFAEHEGFNLYLDLFEKVSKIDLSKLGEDIHSLEKQIAQVITKDQRLAQMYATVLAVGHHIGIGIRHEETLDFIRDNEGDKGSDQSLLTDSLLNCAIEMNEGNNYEEIEKELDAVYPGAQIIRQTEYISLKRFTDYLRRQNVYHNIDSRTVAHMIHGMSWVKKTPGVISKTHFVNGKWEREHNTFLIVDFSAEAYKDQLIQSIAYRKKIFNSEQSKYREQTTNYCRLRSSPDD
jgi:hypothetical protein